VYDLDEHSLIIVNDYRTLDAFELVAPVIDEASLQGDAPIQETIILDHDEAYHLYQCLHTLFQPAYKETSD
jgi:hypothetical protein